MNYIIRNKLTQFYYFYSKFCHDEYTFYELPTLKSTLSFLFIGHSQNCP